MSTKIKQIADGYEYHIRFRRTRIFRLQPNSETIVDDYFHNENDDDFSEVIYMPSIGRGLLTWFTFNKVERIVKSGFLDYHKNLPIVGLNYTYNPEIDLEIAQTTQWGENNSSSLIFAFMRKKDDFFVQLIISDEEKDPMRVEFREPVFINILAS